MGLTFALMVNDSGLALGMYYFTMIAYTLLPKQAQINDARTLAASVLRYSFGGWFCLYRDKIAMLHVARHRQGRAGNKRLLLKNWLLPVSLSAIFIGLFAQANPIITGWIDAINWEAPKDYISVKRLLFWLVVASGCWAVIRPKMKAVKRKIQRGYIPQPEFGLTALLFNEWSILTSLILFNGLFLIQNALDVAFLWSGAALPQGMTNAQYAHQGVYPLIATVLLAVAFVLIALKPGSTTERLPVIRALAYAWVGQNVFMVLSSIVRLIGYIAEYSFTWLRVEALIWMALVALGLILIMARIHLRKTNIWLINTNGIALYVTLYLCCFINFGGMIADYNVKHCTEVTGLGAGSSSALDISYLIRETGVEAIPALLWFERHHANNPKILFIIQVRQSLQAGLNSSIMDWR